MSTKKQSPIVIGLLMNANTLNEFEMELREIPYKYADPLIKLLQSYVQRQKGNNQFIPVSLEMQRKTSKKVFFPDANDIVNDLEPKKEEYDLSISRTQQPVQTY